MTSLLAGPPPIPERKSRIPNTRTVIQELDDFHLPDDIPTPSSTGLSIDSREKEALKPAALNFSRPRPLHDSPSQATFITPAAQSGFYFNPHVIRPHIAERIPERDEEQDNYEDDAAPPPIVKTSSHGSNEHVQQTGNPTTRILKPYASNISIRRPSDASSAVTYATDTTATDDAASVADTASVDDTASIAESDTTTHSSVSDFAFDGRLGWNPRNLSQAERERQRWASPVARRKEGPTSSGSQATTVGDRPSVPSLPRPGQGVQHTTTSPKSRSLLPQRSNASQGSTHSGSSTESAQSVKAPPIPVKPPMIVKRTSWDQISERVNMHEGEGMSDTASIDSSEWKSSEFDTSGLSIAQIHKLKKKGINPALYAEMKAARKGGGKKRNLIGPLTGNTFLG